jgi:hypothetical protein
MIIEIHRPELEALIRERMTSGGFQNVEDVLMQALRSSAFKTETPTVPKRRRPEGRKSLAQLFAESPFKGLDIDFERDPDPAATLSYERFPSGHQHSLGLTRQKSDPQVEQWLDDANDEVISPWVLRSIWRLGLDGR